MILGRPFPRANVYYFDASEILQSACERLTLPASLLTDEERSGTASREKTPVGAFRRLHEEDKTAVLRFVTSLSG